MQEHSQPPAWLIQLGAIVLGALLGAIFSQIGDVGGLSALLVVLGVAVVGAALGYFAVRARRAGQERDAELTALRAEIDTLSESVRGLTDAVAGASDRTRDVVNLQTRLERAEDRMEVVGLYTSMPRWVRRGISHARHHDFAVHDRGSGVVIEDGQQRKLTLPLHFRDTAQENSVKKSFAEFIGLDESNL